VIGLVQVGAQAMADRYVYLPFVGLALALVWSACEGLRAPGASAALRTAAVAGLAGVCAALGLLSHRQALQWHDSIALFEDAVADTERNYVAHRALAGQYFNRGDYARALEHAEAGARYPRDLGEVLPVYGMALYLTGAKSDAIAKLEEATRVAPRNAMGFSNLGWVHLQEGDPARAHAALEAAVALDPQNSQSLSLLAECQLRLGRPDEAARSLERVVALAPLNFDAWIQRARIVAQLGHFAESAEVLREALAASANFPGERRAALVSTLHQYRGEVLAQQGDLAAAVAEYEQSVATWSDNQAARAALATLRPRLRATEQSAR
jgi:Tfp pilus assembly protein PilF